MASSVTHACAVASSSKTPNDLYHALSSNGLPATPDAQAFVTELHSLVPRKTKSGASSSKKHATTTVTGQGTLVNQKYALMLDEGEEESAKKKKRKEKGKDKERAREDKPSKGHRERDERSERRERDADRDRRDDGPRKIHRSTRKREVNGDEWVSDEEEKERERKRQREMSAELERTYRRPLDGEEALEDAERKPTPPPDETEEERLERERLEDLAERDAFAERMKRKDQEHTKKIVTDRSSKAAAEAAALRSLADDNDARLAAMPNLRERSRQEYLKKREQQRIDLLKLQIQDEEILFRGQRMSKREEAEHARNKELLRIMEERQKIDEGSTLR